MGVMGVEGIFRRCCEFTMEVMRKQQDSILTLLEVLLYDPLYVWTVTPQKAAALQQKQRNLSKRRDSSAIGTLPEEGTYFSVRIPERVLLIVYYRRITILLSFQGPSIRK